MISHYDLPVLSYHRKNEAAKAASQTHGRILCFCLEETHTPRNRIEFEWNKSSFHPEICTFLIQKVNSLNSPLFHQKVNHFKGGVLNCHSLVIFDLLIIFLIDFTFYFVDYRFFDDVHIWCFFTKKRSTDSRFPNYLKNCHSTKM